jgi:hypothetical protein
VLEKTARENILKSILIGQCRGVKQARSADSEVGQGHSYTPNPNGDNGESQLGCLPEPLPPHLIVTLQLHPVGEIRTVTFACRATLLDGEACFLPCSKSVVCDAMAKSRTTLLW